jgi:hypothetical protein
VFAAQALRLTVCAALVYGMRHHLFVWSVFAPKLAYEAAFTVFATLTVPLSWCFAVRFPAPGPAHSMQSS